MNPTKPLLSRKDIAAMLDVTTDQVRRNEKRWGIDGARVDYNARFIRYRRAAVVAIFVQKGLILPQLP